MDPINAIARKHKLPVIEDACQAWLAKYKGRKCGTLGDLACFSFQELKGNRQVSATTVALPQNLLLADRRDMDHIIEAVRKIQSHSAVLAKATG